MKLERKVAVVTGAGRGIGKAIVKRFLAEGALVVLNEREPSYSRDVLAEIDAGARGNLLVVEGDASRRGPVDALYDAAVRQFGGVDVLVNNAAWVTCRRHFLDYDEEFWDEVVRNNLKSVYLNSRRAADLMIARGGGSIINLSSIGATRAHREMVAYDACKGAVEAVTRALAVELAPWAIRVNAISPAAIVGVPTAPPAPEALATRDPRLFVTPLLRQGEADDVTGAAVYFSSDESAFVTGQCFAVDGGLAAQARPYSLDPAPTVTPLRLPDGTTGVGRPERRRA
jgi:NAD(P)-dependent dehydrogenase (short-subunit alcohol dehydrogenase family)